MSLKTLNFPVYSIGTHIVPFSSGTSGGGKSGRFNAVLKYECLNDFERDSVPFEVVPYIRSLCKVGGMYDGDINGTTRTVALEQ